jgi:hypothetical protein
MLNVLIVVKLGKRDNFLKLCINLYRVLKYTYKNMSKCENEQGKNVNNCPKISHCYPKSDQCINHVYTDNVKEPLKYANVKEPRKHPANLPMNFVIIVGVILIVYAASARDITSERRTFSIVLGALWSAAWALLLWNLWKRGKYATSWWVSLVAVSGLILFLVLLIVIDSK